MINVYSITEGHVYWHLSRMDSELKRDFFFCNIDIYGEVPVMCLKFHNYEYFSGDKT